MQVQEVLNPCGKAEYPALTAAYTTHAETTAWNPGPEYVWVFTTTAAYVEVGVGAVATTASTPLPANTPRLFKLPDSARTSPWVVSAVQIAAGGNVYAKPCNGG